MMTLRMMTMKPATTSLFSKSSKMFFQQPQQPQLQQLQLRSLLTRRRLSPKKMPKKKPTTAAAAVPTLAQAVSMPTDLRSVDNQSLVLLAHQKVHAACREMLLRHVMQTDHCSYTVAQTVLEEQIDPAKRQGQFLLALPYQIGIVAAVSAGLSSIPMVFDVHTAVWFNEGFVTTEVPEPADLETVWEVGSWTWNWMEPPLGTISFLLLALQYSRSQMQNLGVRPYTSAMKRWRGGKLAEQFPQYNADLLRRYSETAPLWS